MKYSISCFLLLLSILLFSELINARKDMGGYWKSMMNDQPMPEAIKDLLSHQDMPSLSASTANKDNPFVRDFDVRPNVIIYHSAHHHHHHAAEDQKPEQEVEEVNPVMEPKPRIIQTVNHV